MDETPIYARVAYDQGWHPGQLRAPFDMRKLIAWSYERAEIRAHLRQQIAHRQRQRRGHTRRLTPLP